MSAVYVKSAINALRPSFIKPPSTHDAWPVNEARDAFFEISQKQMDAVIAPDSVAIAVVAGKKSKFALKPPTVAQAMTTKGFLAWEARTEKQTPESSAGPVP